MSESPKSGALVGVSFLVAWVALCGLVGYSGWATQQLVQQSEAATVDQLCQSLLNDWELLEAMRTNGWQVSGIQSEAKRYREYFCPGWVQPNLRTP